MIGKPNDDERESLELIGKTGRTSKAVEYLRRQLTEQRRLNDREKDDVTLRQRQGACQCLDYLLSTILGTTRHDAG